MEAPTIELRHDVLSDKTHIADGIGFLCDRLYLGWQGRRQQATEVIRAEQGTLPDVNCRLCARSYADARRPPVTTARGPSVTTHREDVAKRLPEGLN